MRVISANQVKKAFPVGNQLIEVLKGISFDVEEGDFLSIMGPSGCGKSTLLYILGGLDKPSDGEVELLGRDLNKIKEKEISMMRRREVGFMFQFYNLIPSLSVEDNILIPLILDRKPVRDYRQKLTNVLEKISLLEKRHVTPRELSGGQQQRVAIARTLLFDPKILFLDEPIGNLDSKTGFEIMGLFKDINKETGTTLVQVTHSLEAAHYGNKLLNIRDGEICGQIEVLTDLDRIENSSARKGVKLT